MNKKKFISTRIRIRKEDIETHQMSRHISLGAINIVLKKNDQQAIFIMRKIDESKYLYIYELIGINNETTKMLFTFLAIAHFDILHKFYSPNKCNQIDLVNEMLSAKSEPDVYFDLILEEIPTALNFKQKYKILFDSSNSCLIIKHLKIKWKDKFVHYYNILPSKNADLTTTKVGESYQFVELKDAFYTKYLGKKATVSDLSKLIKDYDFGDLDINEYMSYDKNEIFKGDLNNLDEIFNIWAF